MKRIALLLLLPGLFLGCATASQAPSEELGVRTMLSSAFEFRPGIRVLVLPFRVTGNPDKTEDSAEADFLSFKLAEAGFVIVDSTLFRKHDLELDGLLPDDDLASIRRKLDVALIAHGTTSYAGGNASRSLFGKSYRYLESASVRLVDLATGEAVIIATARGRLGQPGCRDGGKHQAGAGEAAGMKLQNVQVANYKCIRNPCQFDVSGITCLIGKNESGKTAILEALYRLNPLIPGDGLFNVDDDFPRIDVEDYRIDVADGKREPAIVTKVLFLLEAEDLKELEADFPGVLAKPELVLSKGYANELYAELLIDEQKAVAGLLEKAQIGATQLKTLAKCSTLSELAEALKGLAGDKKAVSLSSRLAEIQEKGLLDHIYRKYIEARVPKLLYFDEFYNVQGHANLQALAERRRQNRLLESDYPLLGLIDLARLNLEDIDNPARALERDNRLEGASNHLTKRLMKYWSQNGHLEMRFDIRPGLPGDPEGMQSGTNLWGHVYNSRQKVHTLLGRRSRGFVWFFSFLAWFSREKKRDIPIILLLDEPALYLHGSAQRDLLRYFEDEAATGHQVIYTSQSPYMVDAGHLERVRIVEDKGAEADPEALAAGAGTQVFVDVPSAGPESVLTLRGALAHKLFGDLFPGRHPLLVESVADLVFLQSMSSLLAGMKREALDARWNIVPVGGAKNLLIAASLWGRRPAMRRLPCWARRTGNRRTSQASCSKAYCGRTAFCSTTSSPGQARRAWRTCSKSISTLGCSTGPTGTPWASPLPRVSCAAGA